MEQISAFFHRLSLDFFAFFDQGADWVARRVAALIGAIMFAVAPTMPAYLANQFGPGLAVLPWYAATGVIRPRTNDKVDAFNEKVDGFMRGVTHVDSEPDSAVWKASNFNWATLSDLPMPVLADGNENPEYIAYIARCRVWKEAGTSIKVVTPYPIAYSRIGIDPRTEEGVERVREIARKIIRDLRDCVGAIQISNELSVPRFNTVLEADGSEVSLTAEQAAVFLGEQGKAMAEEGKGNVIVGWNNVAPGFDIHMAMKPWFQYFDYVGLDMYLGMWFPTGNWPFLFELMLDMLWSYVQLPIVFCEIGYTSFGTPKTQAEKDAHIALLTGGAYTSEADAKANIADFITRLPQVMQDTIRRDAAGNEEYFVFDPKSDFYNHLFKQMAEGHVISGYPHSEKGQADFYQDMIPRIVKNRPYLRGMLIHCWSDSNGTCYYCGQEDCPSEDGLGLVILDNEGNASPKLGYYTAREALRNVK
ncbi:MAG: hypothetical protein LBC83_01570 [Oscillospiraceae bacterium]|jgi:hypothetical protein|nr:hypothetical protein [Oscillospiraceae bacterium]